MKKLNKIVLSIGTAASIAAPIAMVVSCGSKTKETIETPNAKPHTNPEGPQGSNQGQPANPGSNQGQTDTSSNQGQPANPGSNQEQTTDTSSNQEQTTDTNKEAPSPAGEDTKPAGSTDETLKQTPVISQADQDKAYKEIVTKLDAMKILPATIEVFAEHSNVGKALVTFLKKDPTDLLKVLETKGSPAQIVLASAKFLKEDITTPVIRETFKDLIESVDVKGQFFGLAISKVQALLKKIMPSIAEPVVSVGFGALEGKVTSATPAEITSVKEKILKVINTIDIDAILDKIIKLNGEVIPSLSAGSNSINGFIETVLGPIMKLNKADQSKTGFAQILGMLSATQTVTSSQGYKDALSKLETEFSAFKDLSASQKDMIAPILVPLFESIKNGAATTPAGIDSLDLNLVENKIPEFISTLEGTVQSLLGFNLQSLITSMNLPTMGFNLVMGLTPAQGSKFGNIIKELQKWLAPSLTDDLLNKVNAANERVNVANTEAAAKHGNQAAADEQKQSKIDLDVLQKQMQALIQKDQASGIQKIQNIFDWILKAQSSLQTFAKDFAEGSSDGKYVKIVSSDDLKNNLKQAIIDMLSIKLPSIPTQFISMVQSFVPSFQNGGSILGLFTGVLNKLASMPASPAVTSANAIYTNAA